MSIVGILAWRSALTDSAPIEVPDFRAESARKPYENDDWSPDPKRKKEGQPPSSILGNIEPSEATIAYAERGLGKAGVSGVGFTDLWQHHTRRASILPDPSQSASTRTIRRERRSAFRFFLRLMYYALDSSLDTQMSIEPK